MSNDSTSFTVGFILGALIVGFIFFQSIRSFQRMRAVDNGAAQWVTDKYGNSKFYWNDELKLKAQP